MNYTVMTIIHRLLDSVRCVIYYKVFYNQYLIGKEGIKRYHRKNSHFH